MNNQEEDKKLLEMPSFWVVVVAILIIGNLMLGGKENESDSPDPAEANNEEYIENFIEMKEHSDEGSWYNN